jgi:hypothetical protein
MTESLCTGLVTCSAATLGNVSFSRSSAVEHFSSRCLSYFPDTRDLIARACVRYLKTWLDSLSNFCARRKTGENLADQHTLAKRFDVAEIRAQLIEWDADFHLQDGMGELNFFPPSTSNSANARRLFNINRSGLGSGNN